MSGPYLRKSSWPSFVYQGKIYNLDHLDETIILVEDTEKIIRKIAVTFADHCFTRMPKPYDDPNLVYPQSDRGPGYFCVERYQLSLGLKQHIEIMSAGKVWTVDGGGLPGNLYHRDC